MRGNSVGWLGPRPPTACHRRGNNAVDASFGTSSYHKACRFWQIELVKRPIQIVVVRDAYHGVWCGILEQQRATSLAGKVVGTVPKLAIEKESLTIGHLQPHQVTSFVPLSSPPQDVFIGRLIPASAELVS